MNDTRYPVNVPLPSYLNNGARQYYSLLQGLNFNLRNAMIDPTNFDGGYQFHCVDLSPDNSSDCNYISKSSEGGILRIVIDFKEPLKEAITIFAMGEFNAEMIINDKHEVTWNKL